MNLETIDTVHPAVHTKTQEAGGAGSFYSASEVPKSALLGLPCAHCRTYYPTTIVLCPVCGHKHRLSI
jgi:hypothetical protein